MNKKANVLFSSSLQQDEMDEKNEMIISDNLRQKKVSKKIDKQPVMHDFHWYNHLNRSITSDEIVTLNKDYQLNHSSISHRLYESID